LSALENYAKFCLRHGNYEKAYALYTQISNQSPEFKYQLIISLFKAQRGREEEAISVLMALSEGEGGSEEKTLVHNLLSFLYERLGEEKKSEKHLCLA
jgi:tetratricopeptide (TPR) repeat protein